MFLLIIAAEGFEGHFLLVWFVAERRLLLDQESGVTGAPPMKSCYVNNGSPPCPVPELEYLGAFLKNSKRHQDIYDHPVVAAMIWAKWNHWQRRQRLHSLMLTQPQKLTSSILLQATLVLSFRTNLHVGIEYCLRTFNLLLQGDVSQDKWDSPHSDHNISHAKHHIWIPGFSSVAFQASGSTVYL